MTDECDRNRTPEKGKAFWEEIGSPARQTARNPCAESQKQHDASRSEFSPYLQEVVVRMSGRQELRQLLGDFRSYRIPA
ncbi:hypothetical protein RE429_31070 (plasmid) [Microvirga sp. M2]